MLLNLTVSHHGVKVKEYHYRPGHWGKDRPRQTRQLPRAVDLKGRILSCQSY